MDTTTDTLIDVNGHFFKVWPHPDHFYGLDDDTILGHLCEEASEIGWCGETHYRPDLKGGFYNAPIVRTSDIQTSRHQLELQGSYPEPDSSSPSPTSAPG